MSTRDPLATSTRSSLERASMPETDVSDFYHTGPGTLAGRYLRRFWQPVARSADLPVGRALPVQVMNERFTLYRGESGAAHLVAERCAHRRTQLSLGWVEQDTIRCFYHGWRYDGSGQCVEQPAEAAGFAAKVRIAAHPTREYLGLIFAYLGEGEPPELPRHPEFEAEGVLEVETFVRPCNYFNDLDNACDPLHVSFVHRNSRIRIDGLIDMSRIGAEESDAGITITTIKAHEGGGVRKSQFLMPNIQLLKLPPLSETEVAWRDFLSWRVPLDDERYHSFNLMMVHPGPGLADTYQQARDQRRARYQARSLDFLEPILAGEMVIEDVRDRIVDVVRLQDDVVLSGQGVLPDRSRERLGRSDVGVILLRKIWARELRQLADGRPLTEWTRGPETVSTTGIVDEERFAHILESIDRA